MMNERHEQLMAQAWIEFAPDAKAVTKRFAELIVLECASLFADDLRTMGDFTERACRRAIKEHFGVQE
jgi:hypothetical protein